MITTFVTLVNLLRLQSTPVRYTLTVQNISHRLRFLTGGAAENIQSEDFEIPIGGGPVIINHTRTYN